MELSNNYVHFSYLQSMSPVLLHKINLFAEQSWICRATALCLEWLYSRCSVYKQEPHNLRICSYFRWFLSKNVVSVAQNISLFSWPLQEIGGIDIEWFHKQIINLWYFNTCDSLIHNIHVNNYGKQKPIVY